ncbi:hypothetical protein OHB54_42405 [Streptomyces sp. NBC_01007]|nr:hypothetical protein OHB54_42405 [Streptomyces sp. NBC_01007]
MLLHLGVRPVSLSKYLVGQALLTPGFPDNDVRRLARTRFRTGPHIAPDPLLEGTHAA